MTTMTPNALFARTKLHRPPVAKDHLHRQLLIDKLQRRLGRPLVLVSAPAGYGKSTLISSWLDMCGIPGAWLSLDRQDNDLRLFLTGMLETVQSIFPESGRELGTMLTAPTLPPMPVLASTLINMLDRIGQDFVLVLDDFHAIHDKSVIDFVRKLLRHPPRPLHLVLISRKDPFLPISTFRARDQLTEMRTRDLRFSESEVRQFLQLSLGNAGDGAVAVRLTDQTEGWVTGLRLAVLASQRRKGELSRLLELKGTTAFVREYLIQEVIDAQSDIIQRFLLSTSILDRFNADLCHSLCSPLVGPGKGKTDCVDFVDQLKRENLFLVALDIEGRWFRYHHLFKDLLRRQLSRRCDPEEIATLHQRACEWFETEGLISEAIGHALAAGCENKAVQLVEQYRQVMLNSDQYYVFEKWLSLLPDTLIEQRPELMLAQVWVHYFNYRFELIPPAIDRVESLTSSDPAKQRHYGEIPLFRGAMSYMLGEGNDSIKQIENALAQIPQTHAMVRGFAEIYFGLAGQMTGQQERVVQVLSNILSVHSLEPPRKMRVLTVLVWIHLISGDHTIAATINKQLMDVAAKNSAAPFISWSAYNQGLLHLRRNELDAAITHFNQAAESGYLMLRRADVDCLVGLALAYQARQETDNADATLERLFNYVGPVHDPSLNELAKSCRARLLLLRGEATAVYSTQYIDIHSHPGAMALWLEVPVITQCKVLLARGSKTDLHQAEEKLSEFLQLNQRHHNTCQMIEVLSLQAVVYQRRGKNNESFTSLEKALALSRPGCFIFPFIELGTPMVELLKQLQKQSAAVDHINTILAAFSNRSIEKAKVYRPQSSPPPLIEPLTNRELDVLELIAQRLQNKEIAEKLFISHETVKGHLRNIYQKLGASNRREAAELARKLEIV